jgi:hypothetical protein
MSSFLALASWRRLSALGWQTLACAAARFCYGWRYKSPLFPLKSRFIPLRRLFSLHSLCQWNEVIPHAYGTHTDDPSQGTVKSILSETDSNGGAHAPAVESERIRQARVDRDQFRRSTRAGALCRTAASVLGVLSASSAHRTGDYAGQSLGQQEETLTRRRGGGASLLTIVTRSGTKGTWTNLLGRLEISWRGSGA